MKPGNKMNCPADFDKFVSAEIPPLTSVNLRRAVLKHMMHGPCGKLDPDCSCMKHDKTKGHCKYAYPKPFATETTNSDDGYPVYKRSETGESVQIRGKTLNNRWVIPYNPYLMDLFDCHLNVEVCSTIQAVKYLYKYVYKGHDKIAFNVETEGEVKLVNEIEQYQSGRWVSPVEAIWRIYGFDLFEIHPPVMALPIHLEKMQSVQMRPHERLSRVVSNKKRIRTPLTEFFRLNTVNANKPEEKHLYGNFTEHYRWDTTQRTWFKRKTKTLVIARLVFVAPSEGERYFLLLLLIHVNAPKSFEDLLTVDGYRCSTFQEAALKRKLIEDDNMVELCLDEATAVQMPSAMRRLFATVLIFCQPKDPAALWDKYYTSLSEDYLREYPNDAYTARVLTVRQLERHLEAMGKSLRSFRLDHLNEPQDDLIYRSQDILDALNAPIPDECVVCRDSLNPEQQQAFNTIMEHVTHNKPDAFFVDGPGGTGKTYLYNALYAEVRLLGKIVLPTASSGIAAANIPSGRTTHSRFKLPLDLEISLSCSVPKQSSLAALIRATSLIIWDEASMARKESVEALDQLLRDLCDPDIIFGGKLIVFGGDFRQVLPVVQNKSIHEVVKSSMVASPIWPQLTKFRLTVNVRAKTDPEFAKFLLSLGNGELQTQESELVEMPDGIVQDTSEEGTDLISAVANTAYPDSDVKELGTSIFNNRSILTPINEDVDDINTFMINKFPGPAVMYRGFDSMLTDNCNIYPSEFINKLTPGGMSPYELILKENCPVVLLRNLLPSAGLCNGTRLICVKFTPNLVECVITSGHHSGEHVFIPRIKMCPTTSSKYPFQFQRNQFPLKLSFAMTINKSQGQTLDRVAIYLPRPCFSPGQLYVALSRVREASKVTIVAVSTERGTPTHSVKNIVSFEALRLAGVKLDDQLS